MHLPKIYFYFIFLFTFCVNSYARDKSYLPLGDGYISSSGQIGRIFSCQTNFTGNSISKNSDWIVGDKWKAEDKPVAKGSVNWANRVFSIKVEGATRVIKSNNLPNHPSGTFPIDSLSSTYDFDTNPNSIKKQSIVYTIPANPKLAPQPSCVPMGMIGIALTGVAIFNGLDGQGLDAAAHEIQDSCNGHPDHQGAYHYHNMSPCIKDGGGKKGKHSDLVGYITDGFGIYGPYGENGKALNNKDLDACHGHTHFVLFDGMPQNIYHYHFTNEYPYTIGCFRGEVTNKIKYIMPAKQDGPWPNKKMEAISPEDHQRILQKVAQELKIDVKDLRQVLGAPPLDFFDASQKLGIDEEKLRESFRNARKAMQ